MGTQGYVDWGKTGTPVPSLCVQYVQFYGLVLFLSVQVLSSFKHFCWKPVGSDSLLSKDVATNTVAIFDVVLLFSL